MTENLKVALASVGLGRVQRGFERWAQDLFDAIGDDPGVRMTLFRSRGCTSPRDAVPPLLWPVTHLIRSLPLAAVAGIEEYKRDAIAFALCLLPALMRERFDVIHIVDPPLAVALGQIRRFLRLPGRLLFTDGCAVPPDFYPRVDHLHHVGFVAHEDAIRAGIHPSRMTLIPSGVHAERVSPSDDKRALREKYGVSDSTFVVLMVSAVKRQHKRIDYAIEEVAALDGDVLLWIDGNPEDPELPGIAERALGPRCRITHVPSEQVAELYQLADVMVHASLEESFGLTIIEGLCSGLPVLTHDAPHFRWLVDDPESHVNMEAQGELATRLAAMRPCRDRIAAGVRARAVEVRARFGWDTLKGQYLDMYRTVARAKASGAVGSDRALLASKRKVQDVC